MDGFDPMILESSLSYQKTLETTVLVARAQGNPVAMLPENGVHKNVVDAASGSMEITEIGGLEAAPYDLCHSTEHDATGKVGAGPDIQPAQEQGRTALMKSHGKGSLVIEPEHEGSDSGSPLKSPAGGTGGEAAGASGGEKTRKKRTKNWTSEETEILLKAVSSKTSCNSRFEPRWEGIAKYMQGKTEDECQNRMDTLTKSYNAIKKRYGNERFSEAEFENMMGAMPTLLTRLKLNWYNTMCEFRPPRSNKKMRKQGGGSPSANGMDIVPSASASCELVPQCLESHNPEPESTKVVMTTPDEGNESKAAVEAFEEVRKHNWERNMEAACTEEQVTRKEQLLEQRGYSGQRCSATCALETPAIFFFTILRLPVPDQHQDPNFHLSSAATVDEPLPAGDELQHDAFLLDLLSDCGAEAGHPYFGELHDDPSELLRLTEGAWDVVDFSNAAPWTDLEDVPEVDNLPDFPELPLLPEC